MWLIWVQLQNFINTNIHSYKLLESFCLGRQWSTCHGLVCSWVAVPTVTVQPNPGVTSSVAVTAGVVCTWFSGFWCCPLPSVLSLHFPLILSLLLTHLNTCLDDWPPAAVVCSYSFSACWIDVACIQISFTDVFDVKNRPSCRSWASGKLTIQHVLWDLSILHVADVTMPAQAPLGKQSKHAWYSCLSQEVLVWDMVLPGDAQNLSEVAQVEDIESEFFAGLQSPCPTAIEQCAEHTGLIHLHLGVGGQHGVFQDHLCKVGHCCHCLANPCVQLSIKGEVAGDGGTKVGEILHHLKGAVTSGVLGMLLMSWPMILVFLRLIVRPNSLHAPVKQLMSHHRASSVCAVRAVSSANSSFLISTLYTFSYKYNTIK